MTQPSNHSSSSIHWHIAYRSLPYALLLALPIVQIARHFRDLQVYPFADEWYYVTSVAAQSGVPWAWLWEQHGDHRIPLQKAVQWALLNASDFDFRSLVILNLLVATAIGLITLQVARNLRRCTSVWDAMIPILLFNPMAGYAMWGFHLQFLSSALFACVFAWAVVRHSIRPWHLAVAILAVIASGLCGLNGLLQAGFMLPLAWLRATKTQRGPYLTAALCLASLLLALLWFSWSRAGAGETVPSPSALGQFFAGLIGASLLPAWNVYVAAAIIGLAAAAAMLAGLRGGQENPAARVCALLVSTVVLQLCAVAWGRAQYQGGWQPGLAMHYGAISMLVPILAWLTLASRNRPMATRAVGVLLTLALGAGWVEAEFWRTTYTKQHSSSKALAYRDIRDRHMPIPTVLERNAALYWSDDAAAKETMSIGIPILRRAYERKWPALPVEEPGPPLNQ